MSTLRRVGLVFVSCIILLLAVICPVSAYDEDSLVDDPLLTREDLLSFGYLEDYDGSLYLPSGSFDYLTAMQPLIISEKNYPSFDPNQIPWKDAPQYVHEILNSDLTDFQNDNFDFENNVYKVPFICVRVNGTNAIVYAGYNLAVIYISVPDRVAICSVTPRYSFQKSFIYRATYRLSDMTITEPWHDYSRVNLVDWFTDENGKNPLFSTYTNALTTSSGRYDLYFYGASSVFRTFRETFQFGAFPDDYAIILPKNPLGFQSGTYFYNQSAYLNTYCQYFTPSLYGSVDSGIVDDYNSAEKDLINGYNPDNLSGDLDISIDNNAWSVIFNIFSVFITGNTAIMTLVITILSLGFIALILNR